jgi:Spy/CpxP family protein refolding chaperone
MRGFSSSFAHLVKSMQGEAVPGSRTAVSGMKGALGKASDEAAKIGYLENTPQPKAAKVNQLVAKFRQTALAAHRADETLIADMLKRSTPAQRKTLRAALQQATRNYNQVVGG